jgi:hypothetical protein
LFFSELLESVRISKLRLRGYQDVSVLDTS